MEFRQVFLSQLYNLYQDVILIFKSTNCLFNTYSVFRNWAVIYLDGLLFALLVDENASGYVRVSFTGFGTSKPCGHIDFFPNSGHHQPGCPPPYKATAEELLTLHFSGMGF